MRPAAPYANQRELSYLQVRALHPEFGHAFALLVFVRRLEGQKFKEEKANDQENREADQEQQEAGDRQAAREATHSNPQPPGTLAPRILRPCSGRQATSSDLSPV